MRGEQCARFGAWLEPRPRGSVCRAAAEAAAQSQCPSLSRAATQLGGGPKAAWPKATPPMADCPRLRSREPYGPRLYGSRRPHSLGLSAVGRAALAPSSALLFNNLNIPTEVDVGRGAVGGVARRSSWCSVVLVSAVAHVEMRCGSRTSTIAANRDLRGGVQQ